jgi:hypothetical protein
MVHERGYNCPLAFCDSCGQPITDITKTGILWTHPKAKHGRAKFLVLCKFQPDGRLGCLSDPNRRLQPWEEMSRYVMSLLWNTGIKTKEQLLDLWESAEVAARFE